MSLYLGVDFASIDGNRPIDWAKAKAAGCRFVIIRGTFQDWIDPAWAAEHDRAYRAGMLVGAYMMPHYGVNGPTVEKQVGVLRKAIGAIGPGFFPPALDVEFSGGTAKTGRTRAELVELVDQFVIALRDTFGVLPMIYTSARVWDGQDADSLNADTIDMTGRAVAGCVPWLARYPLNYRLPAVGDDASEKAWVESLPRPPVPKLWGWSLIHQYQGDARWFAGTIGQCDMNRLFDLRAGLGGPGVRWLQRRLGMPEDNGGMFDTETLSAVVRFQREHGLSADGIVGPATFSRVAWANP